MGGLNIRIPCSEEKRAKIKASRDATKLRRINQVCKVYECKIIENKLNKAQREALEMIFVEAKWFYNHVIALKKDKNLSLRDINPTDIKEVKHLDKDGKEIISEMKYFKAHPKQTLFQKMIINEKIISIKIFKKHIKHGELKFKKEITTIPLNQYHETHRIKTNSKIKITGIPGNLKVKGLEQVKNVDEFANANLVKRADGYYFLITTFTNKDKFSNFKINDREIGLDFGIKTNLTTSEGDKFDICVRESGRHRRLARRMSKRKKGSKRRDKARLLRRKEYKKMTDKKREFVNKIVSFLKHYKLIVFQDEMIANWQKGLFGKQIHYSCLGLLKSKLKQMENVVVLDKQIPTTKFCPECGKLNMLGLNNRIYTCSCGRTFDRDVHAARNMLNIKNRVFEMLNIKLPTEHREVTFAEFQLATGLKNENFLTKKLERGSEKQKNSLELSVVHPVKVVQL